MPQFIRLKPVFKETIWGGDALKDMGFEIPSDHTGEAWITSAHPNGDCEIESGLYQGKTLSWLWKEHQELFGNIGGDRFPLLVKVIHAKQDLSIQVHPDNRYASRHENGSLGKAECWYILNCETGADIIVGHSAENDAQLCEEIDHGEWKKLLHPRPIHPGDFFYIAPGTVHAIRAGTILLEVQQSSDITYRLYDYDRLQNGKPKALHIQQSEDVIQSPYQAPTLLQKSRCTPDYDWKELVKNQYFTLSHVRVYDKYDFWMDAPFEILNVLSGSGTINGEPVKQSESLIIPFGTGKVSIDGKMEIAISSVTIS